MEIAPQHKIQVQSADHVDKSVYIVMFEESGSFLKEKIKFTQIPDLIEHVMEKITFVEKPELDDYVNSNDEARRTAESFAHI